MHRVDWHGRRRGWHVPVMIVVVAALKGGVGKTTTSVYLAAVAAASRRAVTLIDADAQASAAEWIEGAEGEPLEAVTVIEAPTSRLLTRALERLDPDEVGIVDSPPGNERMLENAMALPTASSSRPASEVSRPPERRRCSTWCRARHRSAW